MRRSGDSDARDLLNVRFGSILLKKSFGGGERNFPEPLMRFVRNDVRDHLVSQKNDHGLSYWRYAHPSGGLVQKSTFARFLEFFDFRLFQQYRHLSDMSGRADDVCCSGQSRPRHYER